jgi:hypothetical protein
MKRTTLLFLILLPHLCLAANLKDADIKTFKENAHTCVHLSGEWDVELPAENKEEIKKNMNITCGKAKKLYMTLQKRYKNDHYIKRLLLKYKDLKDFEKWD